MISVFLLMLVAGVGMAQAASNPRQVTLRWLRLGGLIAVALLAVTLVIQANGEKVDVVTWVLLCTTLATFNTQLMTVQLGHHNTQRVAASFGLALAVALVVLLLAEKLPTTAAGQDLQDLRIQRPFHHRGNAWDRGKHSGLVRFRGRRYR